jgi:hypothetical protein
LRHVEGGGEVVPLVPQVVAPAALGLEGGLPALEGVGQAGVGVLVQGGQGGVGLAGGVEEGGQLRLVVLTRVG